MGAACGKTPYDVCRCVSKRRANLRCPLATTASWHVSPAGITGSSSHALTFNEELANGDLEVVDKLVEVQKDARGNPTAERPRVGALKTPDAGAQKTPVSKWLKSQSARRERAAAGGARRR